MLKPLVLDGKKPGGQLMSTTAVENWPGNISIMGPELMLNMREHAKHFGAEYLEQTVTKVAFTVHPFLIWTDGDVQLEADTVIVATGASPNKLGCPGEEEYWGRGVASCAVCDAAFFKDRKVLVVGGGDVAMENASFLSKFASEITVVHILDELTASKPLQKRVLDDSKITVIYGSTVSEIKGDGTMVTGVVVTEQNSGQTREIPVDGVFVSIGMRPNTQPFEGQLELGKGGYLVVTDHTKTSVEGVFAAGDVHDYRYRQAITSSGSGCMAAMDAEAYLQKLGLDE